MDKIRFTVTAAHIEKAIATRDSKIVGGMESCCPLALALHDAGFPKAIVCDGIIQLDGTSGRQVKHPARIAKFVRDFDNLETLQPAQFELNTEVV